MTDARVSLYDLMQVDLPEGRSGDVAVERFEITEREIAITSMRDGSRGYTPPGTYTRLTRRHGLWMSDTHAERRDHLEPLWKARRLSSGFKVLVTGLGLGMVVRAMILGTDVGHIDVVEIDPDVVALVGPYYEKLAAEHGKTLTIHLGDAFDRKVLFGPNDYWDIAWHDIWQDLCLDNLTGMGSLARRYTRFVGWQGFWGKEFLHRERARQGVWYR